MPGLLRRGCFCTRLQRGLVGAGQVARRFSASLRELRSRFVRETAPLEGSEFLDLLGPFAAAASERAQAGISCATPFDGERTHFKKPVSVTMACGAVPQQKEKSCQVFFEKTKYALYTVRGALFSTMCRSRSGQSYIGVLGGNQVANEQLGPKQEQSSGTFVLHGAKIACAGGTLASVTSNSFPQKVFFSKATRPAQWSFLIDSERTPLVEILCPGTRSRAVFCLTKLIMGG